MDSNDFGDILLMLLDDDLFWNDDKEQPYGDTQTYLHTKPPAECKVPTAH